MKLSEEEMYEMRRMLADFKSTLPQHDLGGWLITKHSNDAEIVENDGAGHRHYGVYDSGYLRIKGSAECQRCGKRFEIPSIGNFLTRPERVDNAVAEAKKWVEEIAEKDGACWGDVPEITFGSFVRIKPMNA